MALGDITVTLRLLDEPAVKKILTELRDRIEALQDAGQAVLEDKANVERITSEAYAQMKRAQKAEADLDCGQRFRGYNEEPCGSGEDWCRKHGNALAHSMDNTATYAAHQLYKAEAEVERVSLQLAEQVEAKQVIGHQRDALAEALREEHFPSRINDGECACGIRALGCSGLTALAALDKEA